VRFLFEQVLSLIIPSEKDLKGDSFQPEVRRESVSLILLGKAETIRMNDYYWL